MKKNSIILTVCLTGILIATSLQAERHGIFGWAADTVDDTIGVADHAVHRALPPYHRHHHGEKYSSEEYPDYISNEEYDDIDVN